MIPEYFREEAFDAAGIDWEDHGLSSHQRIAARLAQYAQGKHLSVPGLGWFFYDGARWQTDKGQARIYRRLTNLLRGSMLEALDDKELRKDIDSANTGQGSRSVIELAGRSERLFADPEDLDADPYLLNCQNGTLDLRTLELRGHDPADKITKITNAAYDQGAYSARWDGFLSSTLPDPQVRGFLQRYVGAALIGAVIDQVLVIATGKGRNGKSVFAETVSHTLGDYAVTASNDMLIAGKYKGQKSASELSAQMDLRGKRWAIMSELDEGVHMAAATMKYLTGGDTITAKLMGQDRITFKPSHSFFMLTNHLPKVDAADHAIWARMLVVPFDQDFTNSTDTTLETDLLEAAGAVLTWAVQGLSKHRETGLQPPQTVTERTTAYRSENDDTQQFISEECVLDPHQWVTRADLFKAYQKWALENAAPSLTNRQFTERIRSIPGIREKRLSSARGWQGIGILTGEETSNDTW